MTLTRLTPASSATAATAESVGAIDPGAPGHEKLVTCNPIRITPPIRSRTVLRAGRRAVGRPLRIHVERAQFVVNSPQVEPQVLRGTRNGEVPQVRRDHHPGRPRVWGVRYCAGDLDASGRGPARLPFRRGGLRDTAASAPARAPFGAGRDCSARTTAGLRGP